MMKIRMPMAIEAYSSQFVACGEKERGQTFVSNFGWTSVVNVGVYMIFNYYYLTMQIMYRVVEAKMSCIGCSNQICR